MSNEHNHTPTSAVLTNANGKHPNDSNTLSDVIYKISTRPNSNVTHTTDAADSFTKELQYDYYKESNTDISKMSYTVCNLCNGNSYDIDCTPGNVLRNQRKINSWNHYEPLERPSRLLSLDSSSNFPLWKQCASLNLCHTKEAAGSNSFFKVSKAHEYIVVKNSSNTLSQSLFADACIMKNSKCTHAESSAMVTKVTILNEVLQSPWHPRQPNSYKPKKVWSSIQAQKEHENVTNDDKNNKGQLPLKIIAKIRGEECSENQHGYKCTDCNQVFTNSEAYEVHRRQHSSVNRYSCGECHKTFSQLRNFKYHMSVHRGTKEFATTCPVCGKYFNDKGYLSSHMKIHRNRKEYKCPSCPKSFNQRVAYNMHVRIHTGVKPHVCVECGKAFSRKMLLKQHQRTHSGERPYACAHCDKRFADRSNMTLHLRLHTGIKPFSCTLCTKSFTKKHHLKSHLNFHTGSKPYACPRCKLAFTQSSNMRTHYKKSVMILPAATY